MRPFLIAFMIGNTGVIIALIVAVGRFFYRLTVDVRDNTRITRELGTSVERLTTSIGTLGNADGENSQAVAVLNERVNGLEKRFNRYETNPSTGLPGI